ncbi:MAG: LysM peptidoglycan-binding domain-containing protein, partial [Cyclobacteriaceae bacterium]
GRLVSNSEYLHEYPVMGPTSLSAVSKKLGVSESHLQEYNKWTSNGKIPGDRPYVVTYILKGIAPERPVLVLNTPDSPHTGLSSPEGHTIGFPKISGNLQQAHLPNEIKVNGIKGILASHGSSQEDFARLANISQWKLRRVNDLKKSDPIQGGQYYYTKRKKSKAVVEEYVVQPGETLWEISQQFGIRLSSLKAKNRVYRDKQLQAGMVLKLRKYYKKNEPMAMARIAPKSQKQNPPDAIPSSRTVTPDPPSKSLTKFNPTQKKPEMDSPNVIMHRVLPGDTLYAISKKYEVTVEEIKIWNQMGEGNLLSVGQNLTIRK